MTNKRNQMGGHLMTAKLSGKYDNCQQCTVDHP